MTNNLISYHIKLSRQINPFPCPDCGSLVLPKHYEKHCSVQHRINGKTTCVWCRKESWLSGMKCKQGSHLRTCSEKFMSSNQISVSHEPIQTPKLLPLHHAFTQKTIFGFNELPTPEYDFLWPLDVEPLALEFEDDNLNLAGSYLLKFLDTKDTHDWLHVMIKAIAFESFKNALDQDHGITQTLLFSCWCNGGPHQRAIYRQHRHLIVVSPKNRFKSIVWPKVRVSKENRPNPNFACKRSKFIKSPLHLVNAMGYVSHRKSRCKFIFKRGDFTPFKMHHFYLYRTLPSNFGLHLVLFWNNGIAEWLYQEKFQNVSVPVVVQNPMVFDDCKWKQKIKDFYKHERGWVPRLSKNFTPTDRVTPYYFCLMNDKKLYFECLQESMDDETWLRKQVEGGNVLYNAVEEELWTPRKRYQDILSFYKPAVDRIKQLESDISSLQTKFETSQTCWKRKNCSKKSKIQDLKKQNQQLRDEIHTYCKEEIARLKLENEQLKKSLENVSIKEDTKDEEITRLKLEIEQLKMSLDRIKNK